MLISQGAIHAVHVISLASSGAQAPVLLRGLKGCGHFLAAPRCLTSIQQQHEQHQTSQRGRMTL